MSDPILYSFRRCPYCMRAHMALKYCGIKIELREVELQNMPAELLAISANSTVPVLQLTDGTIMDESWDIVKWAVSQNDPDLWAGKNGEFLLDSEMRVETNDFSFKDALDHYKYADRFPEHSEEYYRKVCEEFIEEFEEALSENRYLISDKLTLADIAIFPFVRQFSLVDKPWFDDSSYVHVQKWLIALVQSELFQLVFKKHALWQVGDNTIFV